MEFIVTDLTRFKKGNPYVCIAGVDLKSKKCIRPMPYITMAECKRLEILPGTILEGDFTKPAVVLKPHVEDMNYKSPLRVKGPCTSEVFEEVLDATVYPEIRTGFDGKVPPNNKVIPPNDPPERSIITLKLKPKQIEIVRDRYDQEKIKFHLEDNDSSRYQFLPITDIGFYNLAVSKQNEPSYTDELNEYIHSQKKVYLRIGLGRRYKNPSDGRDGFWIQVNGIYTFPKFLTEVRTYD